MDFTIVGRNLMKFETHKLITVMTELKNMPIHHAVFHSELFPWFIFLTECEILNFVDVGWQAYMHCITAWMTTCLLSVELLDTAGHVNFLFKSFIALIFNYLSIVQKHLGHISGSITLADSQTSVSVFNGKTPIIYKHNNMTSA